MLKDNRGPRDAKSGPTARTGTKNALGHTVASLGIRLPGYATGRLNDGFSYPVLAVSPPLSLSVSTLSVKASNSGGDRADRVSKTFRRPRLA